jgi:hypothetical protein
MNSVEFVQQQYSALHQRIDVVMDKITLELFNRIPPGSANAISTTFIHMLNAEDFHVQTVLQGKPRVWETERWSDQIGLSTPPGQGIDRCLLPWSFILQVMPARSRL